MTSRYLIAVSRVTLVILLLGAVLAQALLPVLASELGVQYPEAAHLVVPYSVAAILAIGCAEVALALIWRLVSLAESGAIISLRAVRLVSAAGGCAAAVAAVSAGVLVHLAAGVRFGGPGIGLLLLACVAGGAGGALLALRVRSVLRAAVVAFKPGSHFTRQDRPVAFKM